MQLYNTFVTTFGTKIRSSNLWTWWF